MTTHLLDANVLIAVTITEHEHHERASRWIATAGRIAVCPIVEGALVRFLVRLGERMETAVALLDRLSADPRVEFWPDSLSYRATGIAYVRGHRQVTDAYLVSLAVAHGDAVLATLDQALVRDLPVGTLLIP